ncbi:MAG TPA: DUF255 domain-containing protein [Aliiroseovarius sp.]|nr:DUF255 domain-containing protein [Aliiroseovarius sp.]
MEPEAGSCRQRLPRNEPVHDSNNHLRTLLLLLALTLAIPARATPDPAPGIDWQAWSPAVFARAEREGKLVLLALEAEWCTWCKKMNAVTYRDAEVIGVIRQHYIAVRADRDKLPELGRRYRNYGPPTTVVYDSRGREIIKRPGYLQPKILYWMLDTVAANPDPAAHR